MPISIGTKVEIKTGSHEGKTGIVENMELREWDDTPPSHIYSVKLRDGENFTFFESQLQEIEMSLFEKVMDGEYIMEMAKINPQLHKKLLNTVGFIYVSVPQGNEGSIPHMHIYHDKSLNIKKCTFLRLDKAEYSPHHPVLELPSNLQKCFLEIMTSVWSNYHIKEKNGTSRAATGYEAAVHTWISTHDLADSIKFKVDDKTGIWIMPPYNELFKG